MHDYDGLNEIILVDRPVNKQMRKLLVHPDRNGFLVRLPTGGMNSTAMCWASVLPSIVAECDELAAPTERGRHGGRLAADRFGMLGQGQAAFAAAGKGLGNGAGSDWFGLRPDEAPHGCTTLHPTRRKKQHRPHALLVTELLSRARKTSARVDRP